MSSKRGYLTLIGCYKYRIAERYEDGSLYIKKWSSVWIGEISCCRWKTLRCAAVQQTSRDLRCRPKSAHYRLLGFLFNRTIKRWHCPQTSMSIANMRVLSTWLSPYYAPITNDNVIFHWHTTKQLSNLTLTLLKVFAHCVYRFYITSVQNLIDGECRIIIQCNHSWTMSPIILMTRRLGIAYSMDTICQHSNTMLTLFRMSGVRCGLYYSALYRTGSIIIG